MELSHRHAALIGAATAALAAAAVVGVSAAEQPSATSGIVVADHIAISGSPATDAQPVGADALVVPDHMAL